MKAQKTPAHVPAERIFNFNIFSDSARNGNDIQGTHRHLHNTAPDIFFTSHNGGHWMATRYEDVQYIMHHPELFASSNAPVSPDAARLKIRLPPQDMDPPEHRDYRMLLLGFLGPKQIHKLETQVRELLIELIDDVADKGQCEFMATVAIPLPVKTFMTMMDMDLKKYAQFVQWANGILGSSSLLQKLPNFIRMTMYLKSLVRKRKKNLGDDPISFLLQSKIDGKLLSPKRVFEMSNLLFLAGLDTVTNAMTFITKHLAEHPEQQQFLRENPSQIPRAIDELMRRYTFVNIPRRVTQDMELNGAQLKAGDIIISSLSAANNDERKIDNPAEVDINRPKIASLAFNTGPHNCAGVNLARLELRVFLEEWLRRVPEFRLAEGYKPVARGGAVMAIESLELCWGQP